MRGRRSFGLAAGLLMVFVGAGFPSPVNSAPAGSGWTLESIARTCPTPEALAAFLHQHIHFVDDAVSLGVADYWQTPEESLRRGEGDCEDYALLAQEVLRRQGLEAFAFSIYGQGGYAHTVCVFRDGPFYHVINQDRVLRVQARSLEELSGLLYRGWVWGAVAQRAGTRGQAVRRIFNRRKS